MHRTADEASNARAAPRTDAIWAPAMSRVQTALRRDPAPASAEDVIETVRGGLAEASAAYAAALADEARPTYGSAVGLVSRASRLLIAVASVDRPEGRDDAVRKWLADQLASQLRSHEAAVLEGELTYALGVSDIERSLQRATNGLEALSAPTGGGFGDRLALRVAAAEIAALLIRAAANTETTGRAGDGSMTRSEWVAATLHRLMAEIAKEAERLAGGGPAESRAARLGRYLCESLRLPVDVSLMDALSHEGDGDSREHALQSARHVWMALAARQFAVACELDHDLPDVWYKRQSRSLPEAISERAANLLCGGRLLLRAGEFRHRPAWGKQGIALTHAIEAYIRAVQGEESEPYARTHLILVTRLARATTAIATLEALKQSTSFATNGHR